ncbi:helix-turn-helix domain-containing protein [Sodalis sp. RH22]|uniref:helix-turn-helix domain-containing protein n=1 Tax=unclassified Sodalis (in: enterobacteria) TaxID=2636512 RepID=UPI0039B3FAF2
MSVAELHVISPSTVRKWVYIYREQGIGTLTGKKGRYIATADFKLIVISEILHNKLSIREAAVKYGIPTFYTVSLWLKNIISQEKTPSPEKKEKPEACLKRCNHYHHHSHHC